MIRIYNPTSGDFPAVAIRVNRFGIGCGFDNRWKKKNRKFFRLLWNEFIDGNYTIWIFYRLVFGFRIWKD